MRIGTRQNNSITVGQLEPRSPIARRRTHAGKEQMPREEKVYREIMGADGKVKPQYEHWLMELDVESDDLLDKKMADFKRPGERNVKQEVLETRYEFHHNKRFYKLGEIANKRDEQRRLDQAKALQKQLEKEQIMLSARGEKDGDSKMNSAQALLRPSGMNLGRKPSGHNVQGNQDYGQANFNQKQKQFGLPGLDSQSRMGSQSRMRQASRMNVGRTTPRHSSMNINNPNDTKQTRNTGNAFYLTQGEVTNQAPKTGASAFRSGKMAPLLTPAHQRMMQLNQSQALSPGRNNGPMVTHLEQLDIERERNKISRFLNTKERSGQVLAARENRIEARLREMEKKQTLFEKRKKLENKHQMEKLKEKKTEWEERRNKVAQNKLMLENKSYRDYRSAVAESKKRMKQELTQDQILQTSRQARQELLAKSAQREHLNNTFMTEEKNSRIDTLRTLETVEAKVNQHKENARLHKISMSQKFSRDVERVMYQGSKHKEEQDRVELEKQCELLEKLAKRKKALEKYEKEKRKASIAQEEKNMEKQNMTQQCKEKILQDVKEIDRAIKRKEKKVQKNLMQVIQDRETNLEIKKERQRLVQEDARKRLDLQKRNLNLKKLQVLDKHQKIDELCSQLNQQKKTFIECSRVANEIRVQKMHSIGNQSPAKNKKGSSPEKNKDGKQQLK